MITTRYTVEKMTDYAKVFRALLDAVHATDLDVEVRCLLAISEAVRGRLRGLEAIVRAPSPSWPEDSRRTARETVLEGMTPEEWIAAFDEIVEHFRKHGK